MPLTKMVDGEVIAMSPEEEAEHLASLPSASEFLLPLSSVQFHAMLELAGLDGTVTAAVEGISDPAQKVLAKQKLDRSPLFHRNDPLMGMLAPVVGLTDGEIDELWVQALALQ